MIREPRGPEGSTVEADDYYDLGSYGRTVTTASAEAQRWFDRGLAWSYGFNHGEAIRCFERALDADPACAMAHWGIAYAVGPNYNVAWDAFDETELPAVVARAQHPCARHVRAPARHRRSSRR